MTGRAGGRVVLGELEFGEGVEVGFGEVGVYGVAGEAAADREEDGGVGDVVACDVDVGVSADGGGEDVVFVCALAAAFSDGVFHSLGWGDGDDLAAVLCELLVDEPPESGAVVL